MNEIEEEVNEMEMNVEALQMLDGEDQSVLPPWCGLTCAFTCSWTFF